MNRIFILLSGIIFLFISSCKARWSEEDKEMLLKQCVEIDSRRFNLENPEKQCDCIINKIVTKYSDPVEYENMGTEEYLNVVAECVASTHPTVEFWPESTQKAFKDSCISMRSRLDKTNAPAFCDCALKSLMQKYQYDNSMNDMSPQAFKEVTLHCE